MLKATRSRPGFSGTTYYLNSTVLGRLTVAELSAGPHDAALFLNHDTSSAIAPWAPEAVVVRQVSH